MTRCQDHHSFCYCWRRCCTIAQTFCLQRGSLTLWGILSWLGILFVSCCTGSLFELVWLACHCITFWWSWSFHYFFSFLVGLVTDLEVLLGTFLLSIFNLVCWFLFIGFCLQILWLIWLGGSWVHAKKWPKQSVVTMVIIPIRSYIGS